MAKALLISFLFGIGFGFFVQRAGLCFAHGLGEIFIGKPKRILRMFLVIFIITMLGFYLSSFINPDLGFRPIGQIRGYGFWNIISGILFGAGIMMNGGCILGTLRQFGEGNLLFLVVFLSFIPGMAIVEFFLKPLLKLNEGQTNFVLPSLLGQNTLAIVAVFAVLSFLGLWLVFRDGRKRDSVE